MRAVLCAALLLALVLVPPASAKETTVRWDYLLDFTDAASGKVGVALQISGAEGSVTTMRFDTNGEYDVTGFSGDGVAEVAGRDGVYELEVDDDFETVRYTVDVRRTAPGKADEYASWLDADGGVLKSEAFALKYEYSYYANLDVRFDATLRFLLPSGWSVEGPWDREDADAFALPAGEPLPRGFLAVGAFATETREAAGREFRFVRLGAEFERFSEDDLFRYLEAATPYFASVYGEVVGDVVLAVSWGDPMFHGGLAARDSVFVHESADLRTLAHEYAHVWQAFNGGGPAGASTIWVNEGDAEYHGTLSLFATGEWSLDQVNDFFEEADEARRTVEAPLSDGAYGHEDDVAYKKGLVMLAWLDRAMAENTDGAKRLPDLLKALNALYLDPPDGRTRVTPLTNEEVLQQLNAVVGRDFAEAWDRFVHGDEWPPFERVVAREDLALVAVEFTPEYATPGETVVARIVAENRGLADVEKTLAVTLDGEEIATVAFDLSVRERTGDALVEFVAPEPGVHRFKVGYLEKEFRSLAPARFEVDRLSVSPAHPRAGEPATVLVYVRNAGEAAAPAKVRLLVDGVAAGDQVVTVPGNSTASATWERVFPAAGRVALRAVVQDAADLPSGALDLEVLPADRDGDGVADADDAFPDNPSLSEAGVASHVQNAVPAPAAALLACALLAGALCLRRPGWR